MWMTLAGSIVASIVNTLLARFFPGHPKVTSEVIAQAQKDRADVLQSQKDAKRDADKLRADYSRNLGTKSVGNPDGVFKRDANQRD